MCIKTAIYKIYCAINAIEEINCLNSLLAISNQSKKSQVIDILKQHCSW